jgi:hypothetical protein
MVTPILKARLGAPAKTKEPFVPVAMVSPCLVLLRLGVVSRSSRAARVRFDYDLALLGAFRNAFPAAQWNALEKTWTIHGKTAVARAERFFADRGKCSLLDEGASLSSILIPMPQRFEALSRDYDSYARQYPCE